MKGLAAAVSSKVWLATSSNLCFKKHSCSSNLNLARWGFIIEMPLLSYLNSDTHSLFALTHTHTQPYMFIQVTKFYLCFWASFSSPTGTCEDENQTTRTAHRSCIASSWRRWWRCGAQFSLMSCFYFNCILKHPFTKIMSNNWKSLLTSVSFRFHLPLQQRQLWHPPRSPYGSKPALLKT